MGRQGAQRGIRHRAGGLGWELQAEIGRPSGEDRATDGAILPGCSGRKARSKGPSGGQLTGALERRVLLCSSAGAGGRARQLKGLDGGRSKTRLLWDVSQAP